jgi:uncharacterized membrane protein YfcA
LARLAADLLIIAALCKELQQLTQRGGITGLMSFLAACALAFFLGMAGGEPDWLSVVRHPVRSVLRTGITVASLLIYWELLRLNAPAWQSAFLLTYYGALGFYLGGRYVGLALRGFLWLLLGLLVVYLFWRLSATR